jgi:hypothetical protein
VGGIVAKILASPGGDPARLVLPSSLLLAVGDSAPVSATVLDEGGAELDGVALRWTSDRPDVATVDAAGLVRALGPGTASIEVAAGALSASTPVTVEAPAAPGAPRLGSRTLRFRVPADRTRPGAQSVDVTGAEGGGTLVADVVYPAGQPTGWLSARLEDPGAPTRVVVETGTPPARAGTYTAAVAVGWDGGAADTVQVSLVVERADTDPEPGPEPPPTRGLSRQAADSMAWRQLFLLDDAGDADAARAARLRRAVRDTAQMLWDDEALPASVRGRAAFARAQASALLGQRDEALTWVRRAIDIDPSQPGYRRFLEDLTGGGAP